MSKIQFGIKVSGEILKTLYGTIHRYESETEAKKLAERLLYKDYEIVPLKD